MNILKRSIFLLGILLVVIWFLFGINMKKENGKEMKSQTSQVWEKIQKNCYQAPIAEVRKIIKQDDWTYQINSAQLTKIQGDWEKPDDTWYQCDNEGNVIHHMTLVKINITISRYKKNEDNIWLNSYKLNLYDKKGKRFLDQDGPISYEICAASVVKSKSKDKYNYPLEKGQKVTTDFIYAVPDSYISRTKYYLLSINNCGMDESSLTPKEHCYLKIDMKGNVK